VLLALRMTFRRGMGAGGASRRRQRECEQLDFIAEA
jgi:hypothetical protein